MLRDHINAMAADGTGISQPLAVAIESLAAIPFDDGISEGPHARWRKQQMHAKRGSFEWIAASMRVDQNLADSRTMWRAINFNLDSAWCSWKSIVRLPGRRQHRNRRCSWKVFVDRIYRMSFAFEPGMLLVHGLRPDDVDDDPG